MKTIVWFREDLRLSDNEALSFAASCGEVIAVYILPEGLGGASKWWLHKSLECLSKSLSVEGARLSFVEGDPLQEIPKLAKQFGCDQVVWNRVYSPQGIVQGQSLKEKLNANGVESKSFAGQLLIEPTKVLNKQGSAFKVFTPFWRHCLTFLSPPEPLCVPSFVDSTRETNGVSLNDWRLLPQKPDWAQGMRDKWQPGESGAQQRLQAFLDARMQGYKSHRDFPALDATSGLSAHLAFGEISPRQIWHSVHERLAHSELDQENANKFLAELGWREFSRYLLVHFPQIVTSNFNSKFDLFPWIDDPTLLAAWQKGETGYPIIDAGMRELWHTGYMHNRVRMIVASFLCKHLLTHWHHGMNWFWDTLVDADIANNTASWQWVAGCGADAAPYFRIFNPILQGQKFDSDGDYVKRWVPELKDVPKKFIHSPWMAEPIILQAHNLVLGRDYPWPIVDHAEARARALEAYKAIK